MYINDLTLLRGILFLGAANIGCIDVPEAVKWRGRRVTHAGLDLIDAISLAMPFHVPARLFL